MRENMSSSGPKKKKKKKDKDKKKEIEDQPSSSKDSSEKGSMFDEFNRGRSTAHKKAAVVPGEAEDQTPLPLRRSTRSTAQSSALPATSVATSHPATASIPANVPTCSVATLPADVATSSTATLPADVASSSTSTLPADVTTSSTTRVPEEGIPTSSYETVVQSSDELPFKIYKIEGKEEEHQRGNE